jgi:hypothetical protein
MTATTAELIGETFSCGQIDDLVIFVHQKDVPPSDEEWERHLKWYVGLLKTYKRLKVLVVSGDHAPTSKQRSLLNREISPDSLRIAVLASNAATLMAIKVVAWFVSNIAAFEKNDLKGALHYLDVAPSPAIGDTIRRFGSSSRKVAAT